MITSLGGDAPMVILGMQVEEAAVMHFNSGPNDRLQVGTREEPRHTFQVPCFGIKTWVFSQTLAVISSRRLFVIDHV